MNCYYYEIEVASELGNNDVDWGYCSAHSLIQAIGRITEAYSSEKQNKILSLDIKEVL